MYFVDYHIYFIYYRAICVIYIKSSERENRQCPRDTFPNIRKALQDLYRQLHLLWHHCALRSTLIAMDMGWCGDLGRCTSLY